VAREEERRIGGRRGRKTQSMKKGTVND